MTLWTIPYSEDIEDADTWQLELSRLLTFVDLRNCVLSKVSGEIEIEFICLRGDSGVDCIKVLSER
jgi:hypothetical protein